MFHGVLNTPLMMIMMMNCFCGMVDRRKVFSLISSRDHCQRSSPSRISDTLRAGFEPAQNLSSGSVEWSCAVVITSKFPSTFLKPVNGGKNSILNWVLKLNLFLCLFLFCFWNTLERFSMIFTYFSYSLI